MKRKLLLFTLIFALAASILGLAACTPGGDPPKDQKCTVTLNWCIDGTPNDTEQVTKGERYYLPAGMDRTGYTFDGWSRTRNGSVITDSSITVDQDLTLYAVWSVDSGSQGGGGTTGGGSTGGTTSGGSGGTTSGAKHLSLQVEDICPECGMKVFAKANNAVIMHDENTECYQAEYYGESIGNEFDDHRDKVSCVFISDEVKEISTGAFSGYTNITSAIIPTLAIDYIPQDNLQTVVLTSGEGIGWYAFEDCTSLQSITIPESVTSIGYEAFSGCTNITSATIPTHAIDNIPKDHLQTVVLTSGESIGYRAFQDCTSLESVTIGKSVTSIEKYAFQDCTSLESVTIGKSVTSIEEYAFYGCTSLQSVAIPDSVTSIGYNAFSGCKGLRSITIGESVTSIGDGAFYLCTGLQKVHIRDLAAWCNISFDDEYSNPLHYAHHLHDDNGEITALVIPQGISEIKDYAFDNCTGLKSVTTGESVVKISRYAFEYCEGLTSVTIGKSVASIGDGAFWDCKGLRSITIGESVTSIGDGAFYLCTGLQKVHIRDLAAWCKISFGNFDVNPLYYAHHLYDDNGEITELVVPQVISEIKDYAFYGCESLTSVTIGGSVASIGNMAFYGCANLLSVTIGESVKSIGDDAFNGCVGLKEVHIKDLIAWCAISFGNNSNPLNKECFLFLNGRKLSEVISGNYELKSDAIDITKIPSYTFRDCTVLTSITIPDSVKSIGDWAFHGCTSLKEIAIPDLVTRIGNFAFYGCTSLKEIAIPDSVTRIGNGAFDGCTDLTSVTIGESVTSIGDYAFYYCTNLQSVTIGKSVTSIGDYAFCGCTSLKEIAIPDLVTSIDEGAFEGCTDLTSVTIGESVTSIGYDAFNGCTSLNKVHIKDIAAWCNIDFGVIWSNPLYYAHRLYDNSGEITEFVVPQGVSEIKRYAFYGCEGLTSVTFGKSVTSIGSSAFEGCTDLTSVTIGESVTSIGYAAFRDCSSLTSVVFQNKTGWQVSETSNMSQAQSVNVDNASTAAQYLGYTYRRYYWQRKV